MVKTKKKKSSRLARALFDLLCILVFIIGFAFIVHGVIKQVVTGFLYSGLLHYLIGFLLFILVTWCRKNVD